VDTGFDLFTFGPKDIFVIPNWTWRRFTAGANGCVLFVASDRAAQEKLGLWREDRGSLKR
jgi:gentisate 1,2-dioxygenase